MKTAIKIANLVIAILFSIFLSFLLLIGLLDGDIDIIFGVILLSPPIVINWITFAYLMK